MRGRNNREGKKYASPGIEPRTFRVVKVELLLPAIVLHKLCTIIIPVNHPYLGVGQSHFYYPCPTFLTPLQLTTK